jgi:hypothetical protein
MYLESIKAAANPSADLSEESFISPSWRSNVAPVAMANLLPVGKGELNFCKE